MCVFTAVFLLVLSLTNACVYINRFTRYAGEAFGTYLLTNLLTWTRPRRLFVRSLSLYLSGPLFRARARALDLDLDDLDRHTAAPPQSPT